MNSTITIRISKELKQELQRVSKARRKGASQLLRESLERVLALHRYEELREKIRPYARRRRIVTDEEILGLPS